MQWISAILKLLGIGRSNSAGWDRLTGRQNEWIDYVMGELDECKQDRKLLNKRADKCDEDRLDLHKRLELLETQSGLA